jgi:hypothetical protein
MEVCRCNNNYWWDTPKLQCRMYGCRFVHALKDCPQMKVAVYVHPAFELYAEHQLHTTMRCSACAGGCVGESYTRDDDDSGCRMCEHCDLSCWCDQREWIGGDEQGSVDDDDDKTVWSESEDSGLEQDELSLVIV